LGLRGELCDESNEGALALSLVFPETNDHDSTEFYNPCGCSDFIVSGRSTNYITQFPMTASHMFILSPGIATPTTFIYVGIFYAGPHSDSLDSLPPRSVRSGYHLSQSSNFTVRLTLWPEESYPSVRTKFTNPDKVNNDLLANVHDTSYCDFWNYDNFTAYVSTTSYTSFDSTCFLEYHESEFEKYELTTIVGSQRGDRVLMLENFYYHNSRNNTTFNIVHGSPDCGSYAYFKTEAPIEGWEFVESKGTIHILVGTTAIFSFLFVVFFISTIVLALRIREYGRYSRISRR